MEQLQKQPESSRRARPRLDVRLARNPLDVLEAQRLRYKIFAEEMGARLSCRRPGVDEDKYDEYCEHLIVTNTQTDEVVGTYRILSPEKAAQVGYYTENEFAISRLRHLRPRMVEIGRSCVHPDYRSGATIALLWAGLARYMQEHGHEYLIGCASVSMADGGHLAANLYQRLEAHRAPTEYRVFPHCPLPIAALRNEDACVTPPLIKGYLHAGAWICGEPAWDPDFNTADLPILLSMAKISDRFAKHYLA